MVPYSDHLDGETQLFTWNVPNKVLGIPQFLAESDGPEHGASARNQGNATSS